MKKSGFTLVELLIVIVILAIITRISIPLIRNIREKNQDKEYENYAESMEYSAKLYIDSHKEDLFVEDGDEACTIIEYSELKRKGLLKDIGIEGVSCNNTNTFVAVIKENDEYTYKVSLECTKGENTIFSQAKINRDDCIESSEVPTVMISSQNNVSSMQVGILTIRDSDDGIAGYYFGSENPKDKIVEFKTVSGRPKELVIDNEEITEAGTYYLVAKDVAGNRSIVISKNVYKTELNLDGGILDIDKVLTLEGDSFIPPTPTKEGFVFEGWYEDNSYTTPVEGTYAPIENKILYAKWDIDIYTYSIRYVTNGGTLGTNCPATANYKEIIGLSMPSKVFTIEIDPNSQGATASIDGEIVTSMNTYQAFGGWRGNNIAPIAQYGSSEDTMTSWDGITLIGQEVETTYLKNIGGENEEVVLTANWSSSSIALPKLKKLGYTCSYNTKADGSGDTYESEGMYIPSITDGSETLYVRCGTADMLMVHDDTESKTFGYSIARSQFTSITIVDHLNIPSGATSWDVSAKKNKSIMAWYTGSSGNRALYIGQVGGVIANTNSSKLFSEFKKVKTIDVSKLNVSHVTSMYRMFYDAGYSATTFTITGLSNFDVSNVTTMASMFGSSGYSATTYSIGNLSAWNTSNVEDMGSMFNTAAYSASTFNIGNLNNWDTSKVWDLGGLFHKAGYKATTWNVGDLTSWDTSSATNLRNMFYEAGYSVKTTWSVGDLSNWNTSKATDMSWMFSEAGYSASTWSVGTLKNWDTSNVTTMKGMFSEAAYKCSSFNLDLSNWNTSKVTDMSGMFNYIGYSASTWSIGNLSNWNTSKATDMSYMFYDAGHSATTWNSIGTFKVYATNIYAFFYAIPKAKATINIYSKPTNYTSAFQSTATKSGSRVDLYYSHSTTNINSIYNTRDSGSYVYKSGYLD